MTQTGANGTVFWAPQTGTLHLGQAKDKAAFSRVQKLAMSGYLNIHLLKNQIIMGQIFQGILGGFSGKVGTVIGYVRNGVAFMRGLAIGHTDANTPAQQEQRAKFSLVIDFLRPLTALLHTSFKTAESRQSGFNAAMSYTMEHAIKGVFPALEIDYTKVLVCKGMLPGALNPTAASTVAGKIDFTCVSSG
jgi:hypothetical protein